MNQDDEIHEAVREGRVDFCMECYICRTPMQKVETNYGAGWVLACACPDGVPAASPEQK